MKDVMRQTICKLAIRKKWLAGVAALVAAGTLALPLSTQKVQAQNPQQGNPFTLVGSWKVQVGAPPGPTFTAFETFTDGGGSVEINHGPAGNTTGIGSWTRTGPREFLATVIKQKFDGAGNFQMTIKVRRAITLDASGNELTGRDNVDLFDPAGNRIPIEIPSASFHGVRLAAEPLNP